MLLTGWPAYSGVLARILGELGNPRRLAFYTVTTILISANWWIFIWAVQIGRTLEASLGYCINPLVNFLLGVIFLAECPSPRQWLAIAIAIAAGGVVWLIVRQGVIPRVSLALALTFGSYVLIRKMAGFDATLGLTIETLLLAPISIVAPFRLVRGTLCAEFVTRWYLAPRRWRRMVSNRPCPNSSLITND